MPKVIPNAKKLMVAEARKVLVRDGFDALSIKAVAEACGVSAGTVYKYFKNRDELASEAMFNDWCFVIRKVVTESETCVSVADGFEKIYDTIKEYAGIYEVSLRMFSDGSGNYRLPSEHHNHFVKQFRDVISTVFTRFERNDLLPDVTLYAELLLSSVSRSDISKSSFMKLVEKL